MSLIKLLLNESVKNKDKNKLPVPIEWLKEELTPNFDVEDMKSQSTYDESTGELKADTGKSEWSIDELREACAQRYGENWKEELQKGIKYEIERNEINPPDALNMALGNISSDKTYYTDAMKQMDKPEEIDFSTVGGRF